MHSHIKVFLLCLHFKFCAYYMHLFYKHSYLDTNDDSADVKSEISQLERQFRLLHGMILSEMEDKHLVVSELLHSLTLLPTEIRIEYKTAITEMFPDLRRESTISDLFYHLSPLVDFLSYGLLKYIIDEFGSATLKTRMLSYSEKVLVFMKNTTVKQLMDHWPGQQEVPPNFSKLRARIGEDPSVYTLYELDRLRRRFCSGVKLTDIVLAIIGLEMANSFIAEWLIPSVLVPQLMESIRGVDDGFYLQEYILMMLVNEEQVFPYQDFSKVTSLILYFIVICMCRLKEPPVLVLYIQFTWSMLNVAILNVQSEEIRDCT